MPLTDILLWLFAGLGVYWTLGLLLVFGLSFDRRSFVRSEGAYIRTALCAIGIWPVCLWWWFTD